MSAPLRMFLPITKVDATQRLVYGLATGETVDRSGEICDYASTKPFYEKWSGDIAKATDGKSLGNVRAMHGKVAAGKVTAITFNDEAKQIEIAAKVVDDAEWNKVVEGVYTGFSQGGGYVKRWKDEAGLQRYTADPSEVSLVDLPCLPDATFQMVKAAGAIETKTFKSIVTPPDNDAITAKATELAKAAGKAKDWPTFIEPARAELVRAALPAPPEGPKPNEGTATAEATPPTPGDGLEQVWKAKDGNTFAKKADAMAHNAAIDAEAVPSTKAALDALDAIGDKLGIDKAEQATVDNTSGNDAGNGQKKPNQGKDQAADGGASTANARAMRRKKKMGADGKPMKSTTIDALAKDLYSASRFAQLLAELEGFAASAQYQAFFDKDDDSEFASMLKAWVGQGRALLVAMVQDEADDMADADDATMENAAGKLKPGIAARLGKMFAEIDPLKKAGVILAKVGARNSAADQEKIQAMHDHTCDLGATCDADNCDDDVENAAANRDLAKLVATITSERDAEKARGDGLQKTIDERIVPMLTKIGERVENIEKQPLPLPFAGGAHRAVSKSSDGEDDLTLAGALAKMRETDPEGYSLLMIKVAQANPQQMQLAR